MLDGNFWVEVDCGFLVWSQELCQCTYNKVEVKCSNLVKGDEPGFYKQWNGLIWEHKDCNQLTGKKSMIWNEKKCVCDWDSDQKETEIHSTKEIPVNNCIPMLNITFDSGFFDSAHHSWLEIRNKQNSELIEDVTAVGGRAACFEESPMLSAYFIENTLTDNFDVSFNFKTCPQMKVDDRLQSIFHNSCFMENEGVVAPSISLSVQPRTGLFIIDIVTENSVLPITDSCTAHLDSSMWNAVEMTYHSGILSLFVNQKICLQSTFFKGNVKRFHCPLILPGEDFCGCLDEVIIRRGCQ
ncbi:hypothetical protein Ahia01_000783600, partial [Argonauta hians]